MQQKRRWIARDAGTPHIARPDLTEPWGTWLGSKGWDWYATMTFGVWIHPDQAAQRYDEWARQLYAEVGQPMEHARALEWQKRGVVHFHALIWNVRRSTTRKAWEAKWEEIGEGWCAVYPYDRARGARFYLGKYVSKGGEVDLLKYGPELARPDDVRLDSRARDGRAR